MDLQQTLQKEISVFQQLQKDVEKSVKNRTKLESQLKENEGWVYDIVATEGC
jgi:chaperonin cofactor prefoldin